MMMMSFAVKVYEIYDKKKRKKHSLLFNSFDTAQGKILEEQNKELSFLLVRGILHLFICINVCPQLLPFNSCF